MSGMEPEVKDFLKRIVWSVFFGLSWLMVNMTIGIYYDLLFIRGNISIGNIIFYVFLIASLMGLIWFFFKIWKKKFPHG